MNRFLKFFGKSEMDLTDVPLLPGILKYTLPLILSGILQLLFNAADLVVVGHFSGELALAAVGATGSLINLIVNLFLGLSVGAASGTARHYGAKNKDGVYRMVHTSILVSLVGGFAVMLIGLCFSRPFLILMSTPDTVLDAASLYMKIYFIGAPAMMIYNFGASILGAVGDTARPLMYLTISGIINVLLNLVLAGVFSMGVAGVAIATTVSQTISAVMIIMYLCKTSGMFRLQPNKLHIYGAELKTILRIGLPAGIQGSVFAISNVVVQSSINTFGDLAMSGSTASNNIESFVYVAMNAFHSTALAFTAQNLGAGNNKKLKKVFFACVGTVAVMGIVFGTCMYVFAGGLLHIYIRDSAVAMTYGIKRLQAVSLPYFLCGVMHVMSGLLRGMGSSFIPMLICLVGACGTRIVWVNTVFKMEGNHSFEILFQSYPLSWILTVAAQLLYYLYVYYVTVYKRNTDCDQGRTS